MISRNPSSCGASLLVVLCLALTNVQAQVSPSPSPTPAEDGASLDSAGSTKAMLAKVAFVRVWYLGAPQSPRITMICEGGGGLKVLGSSIRPDRMLGYRLLKPGAYSVSILNGGIVPDESGKIAATQPLVPPTKLDLNAGGYTTVVVTETGGKFGVQTLSDKLPPPDSAPQVRMMDFSGESNLSVRLTQNGKTQEIWNSKAGSPLALASIGAGGACHIEALQTVDKNIVPLGSTETTLNPSAAYSMVLFKDRYGRVSFGVIDDAKASFTAEELKAAAH